MATTSMTYTGPYDGGPSNPPLSHTGSIPDAQAPYFFACYRDIFGGYVDAQGNLTKVAVTGQNRDGSGGTPNAVATDAQVYEVFAQGIANGVAAQVTSYLKAQARAQAEAAVIAAQVTQTQ